jgi:cytochrome c553
MDATITAALDRCKKTQAEFELWAKTHGGLRLTPADRAAKLMFQTYFIWETELAWRAWANSRTTIAPPVAAGSVDSESLRNLALAATRGEWRHTRQGVIVAGPFRQYTNGSAQSQIASFCVTSHEEDDEHQTEKQVPNALFSAAACPDVVLALIERAEKAEAEVEFMKQVGMKEVEQANKVHARNLELEASVKKLEAALTRIGPFNITVD